MDLEWFREIREYEPSFVSPGDFEPVSEDEPRPLEYNGEIIFVDGVLKNFYSTWWGANPVVISQVVVGAISKTASSEPEILDCVVSELLVVVGGRGRNSTRTVDRGDLRFFIVESKSPNPLEVVRTRMETLEMELVREIVKSRDSIVVKDGTLRPIYEAYSAPSFIAGRGPVGYVKNVEDTSGLSMFFSDLLKLGRGERTRAFMRKHGKRGIQLSSFLKLSDRGELGFVRLDALINEKSQVEDALELFDKLSRTLAEMSVGVRYRRYPENLPVVESLETFLRAHILDPRYVEYGFRGFIF